MKLEQLYIVGGKVTYKYNAEDEISPQGKYVLKLFEECAIAMYAFFQGIEKDIKVKLNNIFDCDLSSPIKIVIGGEMVTFYGDGNPSTCMIELNVLKEFEFTGHDSQLYKTKVKEIVQIQLDAIIERQKKTLKNLEEAMKFIKSQILF